MSNSPIFVGYALTDKQTKQLVKVAEQTQNLCAIPSAPKLLFVELFNLSAVFLCCKSMEQTTLLSSVNDCLTTFCR